MFVRRVTLTDFRNYSHADLELASGRNIILGDNAQGKTNFLEALELVAAGRSTRTSAEGELVRFGQSLCRVELVLSKDGHDYTLVAQIALPGAEKPGAKGKTQRLEKRFKVNGVSQTSVKGILGHLVTVSFTSQDLNLLRGGPRFRREWIDQIIVKLRPAFSDTLASYARVCSQRNRLLKTLFEHGQLAASDRDQLNVWDEQLSAYAARIIKTRLALLAKLLPMAEESQMKLSADREALSVRYLFRAPETQDSPESEPEPDDAEGPAPEELSTGRLDAEALKAIQESDLRKTIARLLKQCRRLEIARRQTLIGPHRDDLVLCLNETDAVAFASQGQQRSIVLSLKLAELGMIQQSLNQMPVLLLDDVMAELDEKRQRLLIDSVGAGAQTIITTTHLWRFEKDWLADARLLSVSGGVMQIDESGLARSY